MAHKCNRYFAIIFEKEELDHKGRQVVLYLQFGTDKLTSSTIFYLLNIQNLPPGTISLEVPLIAPVTAKAALYWTDSIWLVKEEIRLIENHISIVEMISNKTLTNC